MSKGIIKEKKVYKDNLLTIIYYENKGFTLKYGKTTEFVKSNLTFSEIISDKNLEIIKNNYNLAKN